MKRTISVCLVVLLIVTLVLPVNARADGVQWIDLLDYDTINSSGRNYFSYSENSGTFDISMPYRMRVAKVDVLISCTLSTVPVSVQFNYNGTWNQLKFEHLGSGIVRIYGTVINTFYDKLSFRLNKIGTTTSTVEVLSCRVSPLASQDFNADAYVSFNGHMYDVGTQIVMPGDESAATGGSAFRVSVTDWQKYDTIMVVGQSVSNLITSVRATVGDIGLPVTVSYVDAETSGFEGNDAQSSNLTYSRTYFTVNIDLTDVDRTIDIESLDLWVGGLYNPNIGFEFTVNSVTGSVTIADTSELTSWTRFKSFMTGLFDNIGTWITNQTTTLNTGLTNIRTSLNAGFSNVSTWITNQTTTLNTGLTNLRTSLNAGFSNVSTWITNQTNALAEYLLGIWQETEAGFANVGTWFSEQTTALVDRLLYMEEAICDKLNSFQNSVTSYFHQLLADLETYFGVRDQDAIDDLGENSDSIYQGASDIHDFEQSQQDVLDSGFASIQSAVTFTSFAAALVFVQKYANMTISGISDYTIVFTLPLFLGLFFYLCSRIPGVTRWKSRPPKSKGGGRP